LPHAELSKYLSSAEELNRGSPQRPECFILVDDEDRENEGDLVVPAQFLRRPNAINFMARHARGLNLAWR